MDTFKGKLPSTYDSKSAILLREGVVNGALNRRLILFQCIFSSISDNFL